MEFTSIEDIYEANSRIRAHSLRVIQEISEERAYAAIEGQQWSLAAIVEHIAMVEESTTRVCARLLKKAEAENDQSDGVVRISDHFKAKAVEIQQAKLEAPDIVQPKGDQAIAQSIEKMRETGGRLAELRPLFSKFDSSKRKFPHPYFGEMSAQEWLVLQGLHEQRHVAQLLRLIAG